jgi:hypothetical protein
VSVIDLIVLLFQILKLKYKSRWPFDGYLLTLLMVLLVFVAWVYF